MLLHFIRKSFANQKKAMTLMIVSVAVGTAVAASLITISLDISGKVSRELRAFGANILIEPRVEGLAEVTGQKRYLRQDDMVKAKTIFWRHNILGVVPFLETKGQVNIKDSVEEMEIVGTWYEKELRIPGEKKKFLAGARGMLPWWNIEGEWPDSPGKIVIGTSLSDRTGVNIGDSILIDEQKYYVSGILETGGREDNQLFLDIESLQEIKFMEGKVSRVLVSAISKPMDEFAYKDPDTMSQTEFEKWYCTGYITSIAKQLEEVFQGSRARPIWNVAETEGKVLNRLKILIYLLSFMAIAASALGVANTMVMSLLRRTDEIGLMKAVGADSRSIIALFMSEGMVIGLAGGLLGYVLSLAASRFIGIQVFGTGLEQRGMLLPVAVGSAVIIALAGSILPVKKALSIKPAVALKGVGP